MFTHHPFQHQVGAETLAATITRPVGQPETPPTFLIIHGAGAATQQRYTFLSEYLAPQGITSLRFDHSGHGASTGKLQGSNLTQRLEQARAFLPFLHPNAPLTVLGASMGGYIASRLLPHANFQTLIAQVPAAYTRAAETIPFGEAFTNTIRAPGSWEDALIWSQLENFTGTFLLISAENDTVIPSAVLHNYWHRASNATRRTHLFLPNAEHSLTQWFTQNPNLLPSYFQAIKATIARQ